MNYLGDETLERLLKRAGSPYAAAEARDLIGGVIAAPEAPDAGAWTALIGSGTELERQLKALRDEMAAAAGGGRRDGADRLDSFRRRLKRRRLDGFIVGRGDEHQGEFVAGRSERLAWLTGFTGSAGLAVVLRDRAALFVDGRYTLQAKAQVDGAAFECHHLTERPPSGWIAGNMGRGQRLGYDPWLHTPNQVARFVAAVGKAGATLVAEADNPVDAVWSDQPPPPIAPVVSHAIAFAGRSAADKRRDVAETMKEDKVDAAVLTAPDSIAWLLNLRGGDVPYAPLALGFAIIKADASVSLFMDPRKLPPGQDGLLGKGVGLKRPEALGPALDRLGRSQDSVRLDLDLAPEWIHGRLKKAGAAISPGPDPCQLPKACKNPVELDGMRAAHKRDGAALTRFLAWLDREAPSGAVTEISAARRLESFRRQGEHFRGLSCCTISGAGEDGAIVHYHVTEESNRHLEPGTLYLVDSGAQYLDGTTDVTRTVAIGEPSEEMAERFTRVLKGHIALATALFPKGTTGSQLDALARRPLWEAGLDYDHGTGHGVGSYLGIHEGPQRISKVPNRVPLEAGMVLSNEPGYYKTGAYGIRIENLVAVTPVPAPAKGEREMLGFETLTLAPIDLRLVRPSLLGVAEKAWLDAYHARVRDELAPLVDSLTAGWLGEATRAVG